MTTNEKNSINLDALGISLLAVIALSFLALSASCTAKIAATVITVAYLFLTIRSIRRSSITGISIMGIFCVLALAMVSISTGIATCHSNRDNKSPVDTTSDKRTELSQAKPAPTKDKDAPALDGDVQLLSTLSSAEDQMSKDNIDNAMSIINAFEAKNLTIPRPMPETIQLQALKASALTRSNKPQEAQTLLENSIQKADADFSENSALRNMLVEMLTNLLSSTRQFDLASQVIKEHYDRLNSRKELPPKTAAHWLDRTGQILGEAGNIEASIKSFREAVKILEEAPDIDPVQLALTRLNLSLTLSNQGNAKETLDLLKSATKLLEKTFPENHPARVDLVNISAMVKKNLKKTNH